MMKLLVVEDDRQLNRMVSGELKKNGYEVESCFDGEEALRFLEREKASLIVSDIMMPKMDGYALAEEVRSFDREIPILFMTALGDMPSKEKGFRLGIDDYLVKPFPLQELTLRVGALLRRAKILQSDRLELGNLVMDRSERSVVIDGKDVPFTVREFDILFRLLSFPKKTFSRGKLMEEFWEYDSSATSRTVDVYIAKIREKTSACDGFSILTVHGLGYKAVLR
ncbi:MAG: response regulator transcription factor [Clostridia bacterium]|nr:response regulator transcription factor [Clostridia bacterium]